MKVTLTVDEVEARLMLLGEGWNYGNLSHCFFKEDDGTAAWRTIEWYDADTMEPLTREEVSTRRVEAMQRQKEEIQENIRRREEERTHEADT